MNEIRKRMRNPVMVAAAVLFLACLRPAAAAIISDSLGNTASGFADGSILPAFIVGAAQGGSPSPFDTSYGTDIVLNQQPDNFSQSWMHNYAPIAGTILSASITIGIYDHDSSASGSQLASFVIDGNNLTAGLDALFETPGDGLDAMYNEYTLDLGAGLFADLADGSVLLSLALTGPGLVPDLFGGGISETAGNGANLVFSTLTIETRDVPAIPIPAAAPLFASALLLMGVFRRRMSRATA